MRKFLILGLSLFVAISVCLNFTPQTADASSPYRRIITNDTPFYSDKNGTDLLFYLPYTYYVKVIEDNVGTLCHVEYCGENGVTAIDGFVPSSALFNDGLIVENPYPNVKVLTIDTSVLYSDLLSTDPIQYLFKDRQLDYYGFITAPDNSIVFFVGYNGKLGYVKETDVYPFTIENHKNELTFLPPPQEDLPSSEDVQTTQQSSMPDNFLSLRIIIISCLLLAGLIALFVALSKRPKNAPTTTFYDENEFE